MLCRGVFNIRFRPVDEGQRGDFVLLIEGYLELSFPVP